jgi:hypothetical protein
MIEVGEPPRRAECREKEEESKRERKRREEGKEKKGKYQSSSFDLQFFGSPKGLSISRNCAPEIDDG